MNLGFEIAKLRSKRKMSQRQLAEKLHTSVINVLNWEKGLTYPDLQMTKRIAAIFDISACDLLQVVDIEDATVQEETDQRQYKKYIYSSLLSILFITIALLFFILLIDLKPATQENLTSFFVMHTLIIFASSLLIIASVGLYIYNLMHFHNFMKEGVHKKTFGKGYLFWSFAYIAIFILDIVAAALFANFL